MKTFRSTDTICFYENDGNRLTEHRIKDLRTAEIKFSKNSQYAAIHIPNWGGGKTGGYLLYFDKQGEKLWQTDHKGREAAFDISSDGEAVVLAAEDRLQLLTKTGRIIYTKKIEAGRTAVRLSGDGKYTVVFKSTDRSIALLDNQDGKTLWFEKINDFNPASSLMTSLDVSHEGNYIAIAVSKDWRKQNKESSLFLFNGLGDILWQNVFKESRIDGIVSPNGRSFFVTGIKESYLYNFRSDHYEKK